MIKLNPNKNMFAPDVPIWELGQLGGRTRPIDKTISFNNLVSFVTVLEKYKIRYCLSHGTALGIYRDHNFITWDDDTDLALFIEDKPKMREAVKELRELGFMVPNEGDQSKPIKGTPHNDYNMPYYDAVAIKDGEKIECWWFEKKGDFYIYDEPRCGTDLKHPAKFYDELKDLTWKERNWKVPNHINDYLVLMYGDGWKVPNKKRKYTNQVYDSKGNLIIRHQ